MTPPCAPHILEPRVAKPGDLFSGTKLVCKICGLFEQEILLGQGEAENYYQLEDAWTTIARGTLQECFTAARKLGFHDPVRYAWMKRIQKDGNEQRCRIVRSSPPSTLEEATTPHQGAMLSAIRAAFTSTEPRPPATIYRNFTKRRQAQMHQPATNPIVGDDYINEIVRN